MNGVLKKSGASLIDPDIAAELLEQSGPAAMYDYLEKNGDRYASLANGVAKGNSLGGNAALAQMKYIAQKHGRVLSEDAVDLIRRDMAQAYLKLLQSDAELKTGAREIAWQEARKFHSEVFRRHGLPPEAWTLYAPLSVSTDAENDSIWDRTLASAGDSSKELVLAAGLWNKMRIYAGVYVNEAEFIAYGQVKLAATEKRQAAFEWMASNTSFSNIGEAATVSASVVGESLAALAAAMVPDGHPEIVKTLFDALLPDYLQNQRQMWDRIDALFGDARTMSCPLILDLDGNGVETLGLSAGVHFDHDGNGFAQKTGWAGPNDGMLVLDRNGNGLIDDGGELFGDNTLLPDGQKAINGFAALAALDSNKDGKIDAADELFSSLRVWRDGNSDGRTDGGELLSDRCERCRI